MISFDVKSFFDDITLNRADDSIRKHWFTISSFRKIDLCMSWSKQIHFWIHCFDIFEWMLESNSWQTNRKSSSISYPCQYIMADLVHTILNKVQFPISVLKEYVDDIISSIPYVWMDAVLQMFNHYDPHSQFTIEKVN